MLKTRVEEIELNIQQAKSIVELGSSLERLRNNRDFKKVIIDGFFEKEAIRLVHLKSDYNMQDDESQKSIVAQMDAIGTLSQYFSKVRHEGMLAQKAIESDEETRDELLTEDIE
jgi:hypothetical protein